MGNLQIHEGLLHEILEDLETAHHILMIMESMDINWEPEKSFMLEFEGRVIQALTAQEVRLKSANPQLEPERRSTPGLVRVEGSGKKKNQESAKSMRHL
jgi:hypothetical protein